MVAVTQDGSGALTGGDDCMVRVWDLTAGQGTKVLHDHTGLVVPVALH